MTGISITGVTKYAITDRGELLGEVRVDPTVREIHVAAGEAVGGGLVNVSTYKLSVAKKYEKMAAHDRNCEYFTKHVSDRGFTYYMFLRAELYKSWLEFIGEEND